MHQKEKKTSKNTICLQLWDKDLKWSCKNMSPVSWEQWWKNHDAVVEVHSQRGEKLEAGWPERPRRVRGTGIVLSLRLRDIGKKRCG